MRAENPIHGSDQQSCPPDAPAVMINHHVPEVRLPVDHAGRAGWLRLSRREKTWKTAEILILRHHLAILQRRQPRRPKLNWADPALLAALAQRDTQSAPPQTAAAGHPGHDPALAPRHHPPPLGRQVRARQEWPTGDPAEHPGLDPPAGSGPVPDDVQPNARRLRRYRACYSGPGRQAGADGACDDEDMLLSCQASGRQADTGDPSYHLILPATETHGAEQ